MASGVRLARTEQFSLCGLTKPKTESTIANVLQEVGTIGTSPLIVSYYEYREDVNTNTLGQKRKTTNLNL